MMLKIALRLAVMALLVTAAGLYVRMFADSTSEDLHDYDTLNTTALKDYFTQIPDSDEDAVYLIKLLATRYTTELNAADGRSDPKDIDRVHQFALLMRSELANNHTWPAQIRKQRLNDFDGALKSIELVAKTRNIHLTVGGNDQSQAAADSMPKGVVVSAEERQIISDALIKWIDLLKSKDYLGYVHASRAKPDDDTHRDEEFTNDAANNCDNIIAHLNSALSDVSHWHKEKKNVPVVLLPIKSADGSGVLILLTPDGPKYFGLR